MVLDTRGRVLAANLALGAYVTLGGLTYGNGTQVTIYTVVLYFVVFIATVRTLMQWKVTSQKAGEIFASFWSKLQLYIFGGLILYFPLKILHLISMDIAHPFVGLGFEIVSGLIPFIALFLNALIVPMLTTTALWAIYLRAS